MDKRIVKYLTYPLHEALKGQETVARFREFEERQSLSREGILDYQKTRLQSLIQYACDHSGFYRERFKEAGLDARDIRDVHDLGRIPCLTKEDLRTRQKDLISNDYESGKGLVPFSTGGSTGEPVKFFIDRGRIASEWAACWRARGWWGIDWGDRWIWLWGSPIELSTHDRIKQVRDCLLNRRLLSAFDLSERTMKDYLNVFRKIRPRYLYCYASSIYLLAAFFKRERISASDLGLRVIFTTADTLYEPMRKLIEEVFGCPVAVEYGSRDGGFIAHECPEGGKLHIHADRVILEFLVGNRPAHPGEEGEIVLTSLDATALPFIRYRTGDIGILSDEPCLCGRPFPVLGAVEGRKADFLVTREGRIIHGHSIFKVLEYYLGEVRQYQLQQESVDRLTLLMSVGPGWQQRFELKTKERLERLFGHPLSVTFSYVDRITPAPSGKHLSVISEISGRYWEGRVFSQTGTNRENLQPKAQKI